MSRAEKTLAVAKRIAYCRDDEIDFWPVKQRHVPVGCWETHWVAMGLTPRAAHPFDGLGVCS